MSNIRYIHRPSLLDRILSAASYLTMGTVSFIIIILYGIQKKDMKPFLKYHTYQSLFIAVILTLIGMVLSILLQMVMMVPVVGEAISFGYKFINIPMLQGFSIMQIAISVLLLYFCITSLLGKFSYFPWISDNVRMLMDRS